MALKYTLKTTRIWIDQSQDEFIDVRGLGLLEAAQLINAHKEDLSTFFDRATGKSKNKLTTLEIAGMANEMLAVAPAMCTFIIALAADATDQFETVGMLPLDVQVMALEAIGHLTFQTNGGLKNFVEIVLRMSVSANDLASELNVKNRLASTNGSQGSGETAAS